MSELKLRPPEDALADSRGLDESEPLHETGKMARLTRRYRQEVER